MTECCYCEKGAALDNLMIPIADIENAAVYLFRDQKHRGKCIVVYQPAHKTEWFQLAAGEQSQLIRAVARTAAALNELYQPQKINYATYGDKVSHLHVHVVPKYADGPDWGGPFTDGNPQVLLSEEQYQQRVQEIREKLQ